MAPHWRLVVRYMPRTTPTLVAVGGLVLLGAMGSVAMAWAVGVVMDLLTDGSAQEFTIWALILLALELARVLVETTYYWLTALRVEQFARNLRAGLMDHIMKVRLIVSEQIHSGNIVSTINSDVEASAWAPVTLANLAGDILTACAALSLMLVSNWRPGPGLCGSKRPDSPGRALRAKGLRARPRTPGGEGAGYGPMPGCADEPGDCQSLST